jgi:hypothetical protein
MSLSAERVAIANQAVLKTFEQSSVCWQTIPRWDTGDRGQCRVRGDSIFSFPQTSTTEPAEPGEGPLPSTSVALTDKHVSFRVTLGQATAQTHDALLAAVIARTVHLARCFDADVLSVLAALGHILPEPAPITPPPGILGYLLDGRGYLEDSGFRAPSCVIASTAHYWLLNQLDSGVIIANEMLRGASVGSLYRSSQLDTPPPSMLMLGRRQDIAHGCAGEASAGEEPVDLAVSVPPSLEVVGEYGAGEIELGVRVRYATRVKDARGVIVIATLPKPAPPAQPNEPYQQTQPG